MKDLNIDKGRFIKEFLKARHKTIFEWKEDHLRPQMMMTKLCEDRLTVSEDDVRKAYESRYGEKVECRIIEWPVKLDKDLRDAYLKKGKTAADLEQIEQKYESDARATYLLILENEEAFAAAARRQMNKALAASGGKVRPFGRYTLENELLEKTAFSLRPGTISRAAIGSSR